jgi:hypothetical protein
MSEPGPKLFQQWFMKHCTSLRTAGYWAITVCSGPMCYGVAFPAVSPVAYGARTRRKGNACKPQDGAVPWNHLRLHVCCCL